jgi:hypothetical protein
MNSTIRQPAAWSLFSPVATMRSNSFANGRRKMTASLTGPSSQVFYSSGFVKSTGIALAWIGPKVIRFCGQE